MPRLRIHQMETPACALCHVADAVTLFTEDMHDLGLHTVMCRRCGLIYLSPRPTAAAYERFYATEYHRLYPSRAAFTHGSLGRRITAATAAKRAAAYSPFLYGDARLLEIGAGEGSFLAAVQQRWQEMDCSGLDASPEEVEACRARGLHVTHGYVEELSAQETFSHIALFHVLEHALDPLRMLQAVAAHLDSGGWAFVEVPNVLGNWHGLRMIHVAHPYSFSPETLRYTLELAGLECLQVSALEDTLLECSVRAIARKPAQGSVVPTPSVADVDAVAEMFRQRLGSWRRDRIAGRIRQSVAACLGPTLSARAWELTTGRGWKARANQVLSDLTIPVS